MSLRKLSQVLLSFSLLFAALFSSTASAQDVSSRVLPFVPSRVTQRVDEASRITLHGNTHPMARPEFDRGLVEASAPMERIMMVLQRSPEQEAALAAFDERLYDPNSSDFHRWMHADEFGRTFGPSDADISTVTGWLESHGFQVYDVAKGRVSIQFSGTAAQVNEAFHVEMHKYLVNGEQHVSNDRDPEIPAALAPVIKGISSMNDFKHKHQSFFGDYVKRDLKTGVITRLDPQPDEPKILADSSALKLKNSGGTGPLVAAPQLGYTNTGGNTVDDLTPYDVATVYNILPLWNAGITGAGVTIAIVGVSDIETSDVNTFRSSFGLPALTPKFIINGTDPGFDTNGGQGENTEDVEMAGSTAPGAAITMVISASTNTTGGDQLSAQYIVDNETAPIVSGSFGECELGLGSATNTLFNNLWQQAATQGMSVFYSSGDQGSAGCESQNGTSPYADQYGLQVNGMVSSPYVTAVGGTDFATPLDGSTLSTYWNTTNTSGTLANAKGYIPETTWNTTCTNPLLLNVYTDGSGNKFASNEALCNAAVNGAPDLVVISAGSGGLSHCTTPSGSTPSTCSGGWAKPSYQTGTGVPADGKRDVPDVSFFASYGFRQSTGLPTSTLLICQASTSPEKSCDYSNPDYIIYQQNGGTSAASPLTAGIMALVLQKTGSTQGLANPVFYSLAAKENLTTCNSSTVTAGNSCVFYDTTVGTNAQVCYTGDTNCVTNTSGDNPGILSGYSAGKGYDQTTGLGTPNVANLVNAWPTTTSTATLSFTPTSLTFATTTVGTTTAAQSVTVKNTGTGTASFNSIALTGSTDYLITATTCASTLAAGATCTVSVDFKPAAAGSATGTISFTDSATGSPQSVALSGTGAAAAALTVTVSPTTLTFASTTVGSTTAAQVVTVKNTSTSAVTLGTIGFTGTGATSYVKSATTCTTSLAASASCTISVEFKPTAAGSLPASLSIADNATGTPQLVTLSGTGTSASTGLTITPSSLTFPSTAVGTAAATQVITLKNPTSAAVTFTATTTITGTGASSFAKTASTCPNPLPAGSSCTNTITFKPQTAGTLTATVNYTDSASATPQTVALSGTGASAGTGLTITKSLTFPSTPVGTAAATQLITLTNSTGAAVTFTGTTTITGTNASSFAKTASNCTSPLPAGSSCTNTITFKPQTAGTLTATVNYTDSASATPQTVALSGTGASAGTGLTITKSLTFPSTPIGTAAATQLITLTNSTGAAVTFTATTTITGTNASSFAKTASNCTSPLPAGSSCTNTITFKPQTAGALTATVNYTDSASATPQTVALSGTGASAAATLTLSVTSLAFPSTAIGSTSDLQTVTLTNSGSASVTLSSIAVTGTNATSFEHLTTCGATLAAAATCSVYVSFKPASTGALTGTLTITDNATGSPQKVTLTGTGTAVPALKLSSTALSFATTKVGSTAALQTLTLTNSGTAVVELDSITLGGTNATSFLELNTCGATLTAGQACTVYVGFTPTATGALTGSLSIASNGSGSPQSVALSGTGD